MLQRKLFLSNFLNECEHALFYFGKYFRVKFQCLGEVDCNPQKKININSFEYMVVEYI